MKLLSGISSKHHKTFLRFAAFASRHIRGFRRLACTCSTNGTECNQTFPGKVQMVYDKGKVLTLERGIGRNFGKDAKLWGTRCFDASVYPDLPAFMKWSDLLRKNVLSKGAGKPPDMETLRASVGDTEGLIVRTVGIQLRGQEELRRRLLLRGGYGDDGRLLAGVAPADALLLVSGSHPARRLLRWSGLLHNSVDALSIAGALRQQGLLRASLWAVANPLLDSPENLQRKVAAGAEVILTQPPLLYGKFESWFSAVERLGLAKEARLVIGIPMLTSSRSLHFWLDLCGASPHESYAALAPFVKAEEIGSVAMQEYAYKHMSELISKVLQLPGVAGLHVMPVSGQGRKLALQLAQDGHFQPKAHA